MKRTFTFFILIFFFPREISAQDVMYPFQPFFSAGCSFTYATINNWQENVKLRLNPGLGLVMAWQPRELFYIEATSTVFINHDSSPSFENIDSWNTELNGNIMLPMDNGTSYFKVILGGAYLDWKGNYSGSGLNGVYSYHKGDLIHYKFIEGNIGMGLTQQIGNRSFLDFAFIIRISSEDHKYGITDTSFQLKYRFAPKLTDKEKSGSENENAKTENGIPKGKYKWLKKKQ